MAKRKWTPEQHRKFKATMKKRHKRFYRSGVAVAEPMVKGPKVLTSRDAIVFLRQAQTNVINRIRDGELKAPDPAHLLSMQALNILQGEV